MLQNSNSSCHVNEINIDLFTQIGEQAICTFLDIYGKEKGIAGRGTLTQKIDILIVDYTNNDYDDDYEDDSFSYYEYISPLDIMSKQVGKLIAWVSEFFLMLECVVGGGME